MTDAVELNKLQNKYIVSMDLLRRVSPRPLHCMGWSISDPHHLSLIR
jgi:hypothetical protein